MRVIIHGGRHKTGTTTLQHLLASQRQRLATAGFCYPDLGATHHSWVLNAKRPAWHAAEIGAVLAKAQAANAHTLILSGEIVSMLSAEQFGQINAALSGHEVTLVLCFRRWADFLPSRWAQNCRRRDSYTFSEYIELISSEDVYHVDSHFEQVIRNARNGGSQTISAVSYDAAMARDGSVLPALLDALGLANLTDLAPQAVTFKNGRHQWIDIELTRLLNGVVADRRNEQQNSMCINAGRYMQSSKYELGGKISMAGSRTDVLKALIEPHGTQREYALPNEPNWRAALERERSIFLNIGSGDVLSPGNTATVFATDLQWHDLLAMDRALVTAVADDFALHIAGSNI